MWKNSLKWEGQQPSDELLDTLVTNEKQITINFSDLMDDEEWDEIKSANFKIYRSDNGFTVNDILHKGFNFLAKNVPKECRMDRSIAGIEFNTETLEACLSLQS